MGKLSQAIAHGATLLQVDGNFDDCLTLARKLAEAYPVELVNSVNPARIEGQKTAAFEIVDVLGDAPDIHVPAGRQRRQHHGLLAGLPRVRHGRRGAGGRPPGCPAMWGFQAAGAAPIVLGHPVDHPETIATAIRIGNPASWQPGRGGPRRVRRPDRGGHRRADPRRAPAAVRRRGHLRRARLGGRASPACSRRTEAGWCRPAPRVVCTVTGHGLKDPQWALRTRRRVRGRSPIRVPVDAFTAARRPSGSRADVVRRAPAGRRRRCEVRVPASSANLGPGFDSLGLALGDLGRVAPPSPSEPGLVVARRG